VVHGEHREITLAMKVASNGHASRITHST